VLNEKGPIDRAGLGDQARLLLEAADGVALLDAIDAIHECITSACFLAQRGRTR
jgi:hypothetical protein